jgi:exocyst complex protein 7
VYLRTYSPEEIDDMKWESLETAISLWIQHFGVAVKRVLVSEKKLFGQVLGGLMDGLVWPECFVKIADKIMAVFFRFGEGVARSSKEPEKLFKLLDMFDSLQKLKPHFCLVFDEDCEEAGGDIWSRFRELEKLLIHASSKVFWEFGLQIEGNSDGFPPPKDGSVTKIVRYAINYLKYLATDNYRAVMAKVLRTEQIWKSGILSKPAESEEDLLKEAVSNVMEALRRNVESKCARYRDKILAHVFSMNTYWYIYMRSKNTELGKLLGEEYLKTKYKAVAEESAYMYQKQAWGPLVRMLDKKDLMKRQSKEELVCLVRKKVEEFTKGVDENLVIHRSGCYSISDAGLREQIREAITKLLVPAYTELLNSYSDALQGTPYLGPESIQGTLNRIFDGGDSKIKRRDSKGRHEQS